MTLAMGEAAVVTRLLARRDVPPLSPLLLVAPQVSLAYLQHVVRGLGAIYPQSAFMAT